MNTFSKILEKYKHIKLSSGEFLSDWLNDQSKKDPNFIEVVELLEWLVWDDWFCDFCSSLEENDYNLLEFPNNEFCLDVKNPHASRIAVSIALKIKELEKQISAPNFNNRE